MMFNSTATPNSDLLNTIQLSITRDKGAKRQINVTMTIPYKIDQVWQIITDYDRLTDVIPNLVYARRLRQLERSQQLELGGSCRILNIDFPVRLVLEVVESYPYRIDTEMIAGDLRSYRGLWWLEMVPNDSTQLFYSAEIVPKPGIPIALLERQVQHLLPLNFLAIRQHLDRVNQPHLLIA